MKSMKSMIKVVKKVSGGYVKNAEMIRKEFPGAAVLDLTEDGMMRKLDPGFPLGRIGVPGMEGEYGLSLKGIWEGLKVFDKKDVSDSKWWRNERLLGKERWCRSYGKLIGIRIGDEVVDMEKGKEIFEMMYEGILKERFREDVEIIRKEGVKRAVFLLDYEEGDERRWIDHVGILKRVVEDDGINDNNNEVAE
ncbi:MAG: hypothetical protein K2N25_00045 [Muribaculaceae bacterium]|nr:hypothetical protein [Muribaculaceae bacterium]